MKVQEKSSQKNEKAQEIVTLEEDEFEDDGLFDEFLEAETSLNCLSLGSKEKRKSVITID